MPAHMGVVIEPLGIIDESTGYAGLIEAVRARIAELHTTGIEVDERAGIPRGYTSKCCCAVPIKAFGLTSLGPVLGALGLRLYVAVDPGAKPAAPVRKLANGVTRPSIKLPIAPAVLRIVRPVVRAADARKAAKARWAGLTKAQRQAAMRHVRAHKDACAATQI